MREFQALSSWSVKDRQVFGVHNPQQCDDFHHLLGTDVLIDGKVYTVRGVERFAHSPPYREGEIIGLVVT